MLQGWGSPCSWAWLPGLGDCHSYHLQRTSQPGLFSGAQISSSAGALHHPHIPQSPFFTIARVGTIKSKSILALSCCYLF